MASLWHTEEQGTLGRRENYGGWRGMDLKWGRIEEMCSNEVKVGKNKVITTAAFILFSNDTHV